MWEEFFNYKEFIDPLFRKKSSQNVIGNFRSKGELKQIIIFSSHIDSALQFNLLKWLKWGFLILAFGGIIIILVWLILSVINLVLMISGLVIFRTLFFNVAIWLLIIGSPCFIGLFLFVPFGDKGNVVPGAVDNLSSCSVIVGLGRYLKQNIEIIPDNTEIRLISFGCEECGLRGAFRYAEDHFSTEDEYMALYGFPKYTRHREEHTEYLANVNRFVEQFEAGSSSLTTDMLKFISQWWLDHTSGSDLEFGLWVRAKRKKMPPDESIPDNLD